jgi:hypothetical protein
MKKMEQPKNPEILRQKIERAIEELAKAEGYSEEAKRSKKGFYVDIQHKLSSDLGQDFIDNKWKEFHGVMFQNPDNALRFRNKIVDMLSIERLSGGIPD